MRKIYSGMFYTFILIFSTLGAYSQNSGKTVKLSGRVFDAGNKAPMEYTTITLKNTTTNAVSGGITDAKGAFTIDVAVGTYDITIEFISYKPVEIKGKALTENTNLGNFSLVEDATVLETVELRTEKTTVEIKLDKKVYNVGQDLLVKGGTVSDVLDNIPSVAVDTDGTITLRGNENVRVLIDGRPSNAINISEALRQIPADAIDKVEVVTNPSARYESEGGGGLLNIILKKGKNLGINGSIIASGGTPTNYGLTANVNYKTKLFNLFGTTGYNYRKNPGNGLNNSEYLNEDGTTRNFIDEKRNNERISDSYNTNFGFDLLLDENTTWTHQMNYRSSEGSNDETVRFNNFDANRENLFVTRRNNEQDNASSSIEYASNFVHNFKRKGHKLTADLSFSTSRDNDESIIENNNTAVLQELTFNDQNQKRNIIQIDYVLPFGKNQQFEAGYKGDTNILGTDFVVGGLDENGNFSQYQQFSNNLEYKERVNALYTQYGNKFGKWSALVGLRWEDSNIDVNLLTTNNFNNKRYNNFFPSAFLTYEITPETNVSLSYSRRINRPRGRQLNPFSNYSSNINIFQGNPDLDPAMTDALDFGFLKRWRKLTLNGSMYINRTTDSFQFVRKESGDFVTTIVDGADTVDANGNPVIVGGEDIQVPVILTTPINLATEYRFGFEFTLNYNPFKWWRLNSNFNLFRNETQGDFTYTSTQGEEVTQNFDNIAFGWFSRINSKVSLPYGIDWQTNGTYNAPQRNAQGRSLGVFSANLAFSKDILKDKGTLALNVQDVFNSRKRINETNLAQLNSYSEQQWRVRTITMSFTYRFNKSKTDKDRPTRRDDDGGDFPG
ncbi:outer membrane beta-barrel family protein [Flavobacterium aurantiibacter]|uniref:TonB-dependent receptor n=1 Tax=Flavobacterium aurantiibacter TaxID=2023067 RepID=A0A255ZJH7_9FLAO|nr:outer membrane beta-barrel family protein [Flavobacterium aurantiibacter]OYQ41569.1 TonB-dependent receptor [Flavobacterium aurantiibacter]